MEFHTIKFTTPEIARHRESLGSLIGPAKMEKIEAYRFQDDRDRSLIGEVLARTVLCKSLGARNMDLAIDISPFGKPHVRNMPGLEFNIAHSGNWIVCGAGPGRIGVDVERIGEMDAGFAERYFAPDESKLLRDSDDETGKRMFYSIWTLKESYIKALGKGLSIPLDGFSIRFQPDGIRAVAAGEDSGFNFRLFPNIDSDYSFAMCGETPPPEKARAWNLEELVREFLRFH